MIKITLKELKQLIKEEVSKIVNNKDYIEEGGPGSGRKPYGQNPRWGLRNMKKTIKSGKYPDGQKMSPKEITLLKRRYNKQIQKYKGGKKLN